VTKSKDAADIGERRGSVVEHLFITENECWR